MGAAAALGVLAVLTLGLGLYGDDEGVIVAGGTLGAAAIYVAWVVRGTG